jgi:hypothetical protein
LCHTSMSVLLHLRHTNMLGTANKSLDRIHLGNNPIGSVSG